MWAGTRCLHGEPPGAFRLLRVKAALPRPKSVALMRRPRRSRSLFLDLLKLLLLKLRLRLAAVRMGQLRVVLLRKHSELVDAGIVSDARSAWESMQLRSPTRGWKKTTLWRRFLHWLLSLKAEVQVAAALLWVLRWEPWWWPCDKGAGELPRWGSVLCSLLRKWK